MADGQFDEKQKKDLMDRLDRLADRVAAIDATLTNANAELQKTKVERADQTKKAEAELRAFARASGNDLLAKFITSRFNLGADPVKLRKDVMALAANIAQMDELNNVYRSESVDTPRRSSSAGQAF